jgi:hypothetical protein
MLRARDVDVAISAEGDAVAEQLVRPISGFSIDRTVPSV